MNLNGASVVITGASRGLGVPIAKEFAKKGANLVLVARSLEELKKQGVKLKIWAEKLILFPLIWKKFYWYLIILFMFFCPNPMGAIAGIKNFPPKKACNLLNDIGLPTGGWKTYYENDNGCASRPKFLSPGEPFRNFISYNVEGNGQIVKQIGLIVNVLNPKDAELARTQFKKAAEYLIIKITSKPMPDSIPHSIENGIDLILKIDDLYIEVTREEWVMTTDWESLRCYEIKLIIR
mgnify:CR=1 FL=1